MIQCNNKGAIAAINLGYSKIPGILHLLLEVFVFLSGGTIGSI